jgi:DnaD/phage-associated family protein|nr:MAG TPA: replisome organizer [Caudoviricetes sp.]
MEGWIKLHRKTLDNPIITKDSDYLAVWIYLLLNTTHKEYDVLFKGERVTLKRGQLLTGRKSISEKLKIDENKVQRILKSLENEHQIEQQKSNKNRLITIVSWDKYQQDEQQNEQQLNNKRTTTEQQVNTNKNVKNIKNDDNITTTVGDSCVDGLQEIIEFYNNNIGLIAPYGVEILSDYLKEMPVDLIILAMQKAVEADKRTIQYVKGILNNWSKKGIKSVIDAEKEDKQFQSAKQENKNASKSYNNYEQRQYNDLNSLYANKGV